MMNFGVERLLRRGSFGQMSQGVSLDQAVEFLRKILRMVSAALQRLRHQQHVEAQRILLSGSVEMALEQGVTDAVQFCIGTQNLAGILDVERDESAMDVFQHIVNDG